MSLPRLNTNQRAAAIGALGAMLAFFVFGGGSALLAGRGTAEPIDAVPNGAFLVATVDVAELRHSPIYDALVGKELGGGRALGMGGLSDACGFDPITRVQRLALAVPEEGDRGEFGVAAHVEITGDELETCARTLADKRGGSASTRRSGSFFVIDDGAGKGSGPRPQIAYGLGGLLVVGKGTWFDAMLAAAEHSSRARDGAEHAALRTALTSREGWRRPTLVATAILPRTLRDRLRKDFDHEADADGGGSGASNALMSGVLGVASAGVALRAGGPGQNVDLAVELTCDSADACAAVQRLVQKKRLEWSRDLSLRFVGLGPVIDSLESEAKDTHLRASLSAASTALAGTIERILKLRGRKSESPLPPAGLPAPPRTADEKMPARDAGASRP